MTPKDFEKFSEGVTGVYSFYGKEVSAFALDVWWSSLKAYDLPAVIQAFNRHLMNPDTGQWLPKPADIVKMFGGRTQDRAMQAWSKVDKAVRTVGPHQSVAFDDPVIHRVLQEMGGWIGFGQKSEDDWPFVAKEFETRYRSYAMRGEVPEYPPVLVGVSEAYNDQKGFKSAPPMLIGNPAQAQQVIGNGSKAPMIGVTRADAALQLVDKGAKDAA